MELKVLRHQSMGLTGRHVLKSIANENLTRLGLLVRECVQNSLDAAEDKNPGNKVIVDTIIGKTDAKSLNKIFKGLTAVLDKKYSGQVDYLAIRDSKTVGLTGPLKESEIPPQGDFGNLRKLIYEFGQPQESFGGGGSWGIGKTVCFRIGCGLVIYYSRIKDGNKYQSRLAATLIENETNKKDSLLDAAKLVEGRASTGIAWWGEIDDTDGSSYPITNEREINKVLDCFNIKPYLGDETGTCVIIPYINTAELIANANPANVMHGDLAYFIRLLVQRWYFPRLVNKEYLYGPWLEFKINGVSIKPAERYEYFNIMTNLYNLANGYLKNDKIAIPDGYHIKKVDLRSEFTGSSTAGVVAFTKVTDRDLKMLPPSNEFIPYTLLNRDEEDDETGNMPIIAYARQAGMIINYEILSAWTRNLPKLPEGEFVLAFFQPKGNQYLKDANISLDEYIRTGEKADHHVWLDHEVNGKVRRIIDKIIKHVPQKIAEEIVVSASEVKAQSEKALQKSLGKFFLPNTGFGKRPGKVGDPPGGKDRGQRVSRNVTVTMKNSTFKEGRIAINFNVNMKAECKGVKLILKAHTSDKEIIADNWERDIGKAFPAEINVANSHASAGFRRDLTLTPVKTSNYGIVYGLKLARETSMVGDLKIAGEIQFVCSDKTISVRLLAEEMESSK